MNRAERRAVARANPPKSITVKCYRCGKAFEVTLNRSGMYVTCSCGQRTDVEQQLNKLRGRGP